MPVIRGIKVASLLYSDNTVGSHPMCVVQHSFHKHLEALQRDNGHVGKWWS